MRNAGSLIRDVSEKMQRCGTIGQEASDRRDAARRELQRQGISSFIDSGPPQLYSFTLNTPHEVVIVGAGLVTCEACGGMGTAGSMPQMLTCQTCHGRKQVQPRTTLIITGFILNPAQDWSVAGYHTVRT